VESSITTALNPATLGRLAARLENLYGAAGTDSLRQIVDAVEQFVARSPDESYRGWDPSDVVLITYGDQVREEGKPPLATLGQVLRERGLDQLLSTVHLLPFYPYSSDDGFSVIDYTAVNPDLGSWDDIAELQKTSRLAFDLVLNHMSSQSEWFASYLRGEEPYARFFREADPDDDLSAAVRPRSSPLLTPFETHRGTRHVWTTFSADQVDLNFAEPIVLVTMLEVLLEYVARGAQIIRLDAIAFLWKESGTSCLHLWQTHEVVKLMRDILSAVAPQVWLLTETNVPYQENVSYFGTGDEAQLVYQFSLPPLLLDAFTHGDATLLMRWLVGLEKNPSGTTFLNFTASHDGIGVRPLEGLVPEEQIGRLVSAMQERGGLVSSRRREDGVDVPYELNISYVDALAPTNSTDTELHARRFLATQAVMLALQGIPAIYFHSLFGTQNDVQGAQLSGQSRRINRRKFHRHELDTQIDHPNSLSGRIYAGYRHLLRLRRKQSAFHPNAEQTPIDTGNPALISFLRFSENSGQTVLVVANVGSERVLLDVTKWLTGAKVQDLISGWEVPAAAQTDVLPGQACWLTGIESG